MAGVLNRRFIPIATLVIIQVVMLLAWAGEWCPCGSDSPAYYEWSSDLYHHGTLPSVSWSPLYIATYAPFHALGERDTIYTAHRVTVFVTITILTYVLLCQFTRQRWAWLLTLLSMLIGTHWRDDTIVHTFVMIPVILLLYAAVRWPRRHALVLLVALALALVRPDYTLLLILLALWYWWHE